MITLMTLATLFALQAPMAAESPRVVRPLNDGWEFRKADAGGEEAAPSTIPPTASWQRVTLPHTWNATDAQAGGAVYEGVGWYRRHLAVEPGWRGRRVFLHFEGVGQEARVYVNGQPVGRPHLGAYSAFDVDLTDALDSLRDNLVAVRADNRMRPDVIPTNNNLFMVFGGVYRPVSLIITEPVHIGDTDFAGGLSGVVIRQKDVSAASAWIPVETRLTNATPIPALRTVRARVLDAGGGTVAEQEMAITVQPARHTTASLTLTLLRPHLWNGRKDPYLYHVEVDLLENGRVTDRVTQPLGVRSFRIDATKGFILNGEPYRLYGVARHQEWQDQGSALTDAEHRRDMALMAEMGVTSLRLAHYQQSETMYALADSLGILVWAEIPWVNKSTGQEANNAERQLSELILQNQNHPSIFVWGLHNEVYAKDTAEAQVALTRRLHELAKGFDPDRPTVTTSGYGDLNRPMNWHADLQAMNRYIGWYDDGGMEGLEAWIQGIERDRPQGGVAIGEYGAEGNVMQHSENDRTHGDPEKGQFFPEEYQTRFHETQWAQISRHPAIWASYVWNMFDFAVPKWNRGGVVARNQKGLVTYDRQTKKDAFFFYKASWTTTPVLHIADKRLVTRTKPTMTLTVYSNLGAPTATVRGRSLGAPRSGGSPAHWIWTNVPLVAGDNPVKVTITKNGRSYSDSTHFHRIP